MAFQNSVWYTAVTTTGSVFGTLPAGANYVIHGYSLKGSGAVASLDVNDAGGLVFSIPALAAAGSLTPNMFPVGVKFSGAITLTGTSTNLTQVTFFYNRE